MTTKQTTTTPTPEALAQEFITVLRDWLTPDQWQAMCAANRDEPNPSICHSHDYLDANMAMSEAFFTLAPGLRFEDDAHTALWNAAWAAAMPTLRGEEVPRGQTV